jgi:hypothetical protein
MAALEQAYICFYDHVEDGNMEPWTPSRFQDFSALDAYAKYFSHKGTHADAAREAFDTKVDPEGVLQALVDNDFFHGPDNVVDYMLMMEGDEGNEEHYCYYASSLTR